MNTPCVEFAGTPNSSGYGAVSYNGGTIGAHVKAFIDRYGEVKDGHVVMHECDNRLCINPDHLVSGTQSDNLKDAYIKGRLFRKLDRETVAAIKAEHSGKYGENVRLAAKYGVSPGMIGHIVSGRRHKYHGSA